MKNKNKFLVVVVIFLVIILTHLSLFSSSECISAYKGSYSSGGYVFGVAFSAFIIDILVVFFAMLVWLISPIGILLLLGVKLFFSKEASRVRKNFAILIQFLSFLSWSSLMFILIIVYMDSKFYQVLGLGGEILNLAIKSGFGFVIFMIMLALAEKKILLDQSCGSENIENKKNNLKQDKKKKDSNESTKTAKLKSNGIKGAIKNRIKKELKRIVDNKIDKL